MIKGWLSQIPSFPEEKQVWVIFAPHAGYIYSGRVAAAAYRQVQGKMFKTVIILAPAHYYNFRGASLFTSGEYETPLGSAEIDEEAASFLSKETGFSYVPAAHQKEHAVEVQVPFIQVAIPEAKIVPVVMGVPERRTIHRLADALYKLSEKEKILVVVSTDLSHYYSKKKANKIDLETQNLVKNLRADTIVRKIERRENFMCGAGPAAAALYYGKKFSSPSVEILAYADSSDAGGPTDRVVGYMAAILYEKKPSSQPFVLNKEEKAELLKLARRAISLYVKENKMLNYSTENPLFIIPKGVFVTLKKQGRLRGCIGFIEPVLPLYKGIVQAALYAATKDPRFKPLSPEELADVEIEISILSPLKRIAGPEWIQPGKHGLVVKKGERSGLLLPQVATENRWDRETFLKQACLKAGLRETAWKAGAEIYVFEALVFSEKNH